MHDNRWARWNLAAGRERATNEAETYLILKTCHLLTDRQASLRALEIISKIFLFSFFFEGDIMLLLNGSIFTGIIESLQYYFFVTIQVLRMRCCNCLHVKYCTCFYWLKKKNLSSYRPPVFYRGRRLIVGIGCGFKTFVLCQRYRINLIVWFMAITPLF